VTAATSRGTAPATRRDDSPGHLGRQETVKALLEETHRGIVPVRKVFVQQGRGKTTKPGPLASFLRSHDERALDAYLFLHAMASASMPYNCVLPSGAWVRALGLGDNAELASARGAVSKIMKRLEDRKLIMRTRTKKRSDIHLLREDGSGETYMRPTSKLVSERWLRVPHAYWLDGYAESLSLPAKVMLLIALSLDDGFYLPSEYAPDWYGISPDSADEGLRELRNAGLLDMEWTWEFAPRSDTGWTRRYNYTLVGSFSQEALDHASRSSSHDDSADDLSDLINLNDLDAS